MFFTWMYNVTFKIIYKLKKQLISVKFFTFDTFFFFFLSVACREMHALWHD